MKNYKGRNDSLGCETLREVLSLNVPQNQTLIFHIQSLKCQCAKFKNVTF